VSWSQYWNLDDVIWRKPVFTYAVTVCREYGFMNEFSTWNYIFATVMYK